MLLLYNFQSDMIANIYNIVILCYFYITCEFYEQTKVHFLYIK